MIRQRLICFLLALTMCNQAFASASAPSCGLKPPQSSLTPAFMAQTICRAAQQHLLKPTFDSYAAQCGVGIAEGGKAVWNEIKSFAKFIGSDVPKYVGGWVQSLFQKDPAAALQQRAHEHAVRAVSAWKVVRDEFAAMKMLFAGFLNELERTAELAGSSLACLPGKLKSELICEFLSYCTVSTLGPKGVVKAVDKAGAVAKAIANFSKESKLMHSLKGLSFQQRLEAGLGALKREQQFKPVMRVKNATLKTRPDAISGEDRFFLEEFSVKNGKKVSEVWEVVRDSRTGAFDANFHSGAKFARMLAGSSKDKFLVFGDVLDLGKANYLQGGTEAGDRYLKHVADALNKNMRKGDVLFKNGGDELVVILDTKDPQAAMAFQKRVHETIRSNPEVQQMFKAERIRRAQLISRDAPPTAQEINYVQEAARTRPGIAMGAVRIPEGEENEVWKQALVLAEGQAAEVKSAAKLERGGDVSKYGSVGAAPDRVNFKAEPRVLEPIEPTAAGDGADVVDPVISSDP